MNHTCDEVKTRAHVWGTKEKYSIEETSSPQKVNTHLIPM